MKQLHYTFKFYYKLNSEQFVMYFFFGNLGDVKNLEYNSSASDRLL